MKPAATPLLSLDFRGKRTMIVTTRVLKDSLRVSFLLKDANDSPMSRLDEFNRASKLAQFVQTETCAWLASLPTGEKPERVQTNQFREALDQKILNVPTYEDWMVVAITHELDVDLHIQVGEVIKRQA